MVGKGTWFLSASTRITDVLGALREVFCIGKDLDGYPGFEHTGVCQSHRGHCGQVAMEGALALETPVSVLVTLAWGKLLDIITSAPQWSGRDANQRVTFQRRIESENGRSGFRA